MLTGDGIARSNAFAAADEVNGAFMFLVLFSELQRDGLNVSVCLWRCGGEMVEVEEG